MWDWLFRLLCDQCGEEAGAGGAPGEAGAGDAPPDDSAAGAGGDSKIVGDGEAPKTPKYGEFGDAPNVEQVYEALGKTKTDFDAFRKKAGLTEQNLGTIRKTLASAGLEVGEDGQIRRRPGADAPKMRFTESHQAMFDGKVLEAMRFLMEDMMDARFSHFSKQSHQEREFSRVMDESIDRMYTLYPALRKEADGKPNPQFHQAFFERANALLQERYRNLPNGDLIAAHEAAIELGISPKAVEQARKDGFERGTNNKRVLGPARPSGQKAPAGKLTREEYLKLTPEEKADHDRKYVLSET